MVLSHRSRQPSFDVAKATICHLLSKGGNQEGKVRPGYRGQSCRQGLQLDHQACSHDFRLMTGAVDDFLTAQQSYHFSQGQPHNVGIGAGDTLDQKGTFALDAVRSGLIH